MNLFNDNMRRGSQHGQGRHDGEESEGDQAETIQDHRGELPITLYSTGLLVIPDLVSDHFYLLEDEAELPGHAAGVGRAHSLLLTGDLARNPKNEQN